MTKTLKARIISNFLSLSALQAINIFAPLVLLPYLTKVLGITKFGELSYALSIILLMNVFVSFGFEVSAMKQVAIDRNDREKLSRLVGSVMAGKAVLLCLALLLIAVIFMTFDLNDEGKVLYIVTFGIVIGNCIFPIWLFQGMEEFKFVTYLTAMAKVISILLTLILVQDLDDWLLVPSINSVVGILIGVLAYIFATRRYDLHVRVPTLHSIVSQLRDSFPFFLSRGANDGGRQYAIAAIGLAFDSTVVGLYAISEKLVYAFLNLGGVASQVIYPYMCQTRDLLLLRNAVILTSVVTVAFIVIAILAGEVFFQVVFDLNDERLMAVFLIGLSGVLFGNVGTLMGHPLLGAFGFSSQANRSLVYAALIQVSYMTIAGLVSDDIRVIALGLPMYLISGFLFRAIYIYRHAQFIGLRQKLM